MMDSPQTDRHFKSIALEVVGGETRMARKRRAKQATPETSLYVPVKRFLEGIRKGESPSPSLEDGLKAQLVLDAVLRSLTEGGWQRVEPA